MRDIECIVNSSCELGEGPVWLPEKGCLYWVDVPPPSRLYEWDYNTRQVQSWEMPDVVTSLAPREQGGLIVVSRDAINSFDFGTGHLRKLMTPDTSFAGMRFNDCGCDSEGRLWTGSMLDTFPPNDVPFPTKPEEHMVGTLYRIDPDHSVHKIKYGVGCPNTFVWSPDDSRMYTIDSANERIYSYNYNINDGFVSGCREIAYNPLLGVPDGSAMDREGYFWNARWGGSCIVRYAPDGSVDRKIDIPAKFVTSCAFGGDALDILYITTAKTGLSPDDMVKFPLSGSVFSYRPDIPGMAEGRFGG